MKEIEVKARIKSINEIKNKLIELGCVFNKPLIQKDIIFLHKSIDPNGSKNQDWFILRIRNVNGENRLTLKKQLKNELDNIEKEIVFDKFDQAFDMLKIMGYNETVRVNKKRLECKYKDISICLDNVEGLGYFAEVEKLTSQGNSVKIQKELFDFLQSLGVKKEDQVFKGYDTLVKDQQNNKKE